MEDIYGFLTERRPQSFLVQVIKDTKNILPQERRRLIKEMAAVTNPDLFTSEYEDKQMEKGAQNCGKLKTSILKGLTEEKGQLL